MSVVSIQRSETDPQTVLLRVLADRLPAMLAYWDANLRCQFANRAYEKWFGVKPETVLGRRMDEFLGPLFALNLPYIQGALRGEEQEFEREIPDPAGGPARYSQAHYLPHFQGGEVRGFCVLVVDITRRKRAEEALQKAERQLQAVERLSAMATLAAGIGHEINNPLTVVLGNLELALAELVSSSDETVVTPEGRQLELARACGQLMQAQEAGRHIAEIVNSLKLLARGDTSQREPVEVNAIVERSVKLVRNAVRYRAQVQLDLRAQGSVDANASQLAQLFVNLLMNAEQAMPTGTRRGEIIVRSYREHEQLVVEVADNGRGIPEELQTRIFEPFFTTNETGHHLGLGLSISRSIATAFGGTLTVQSSAGQGSVFRVALPAARANLVPVPDLRSAPTASDAPAAQPRERPHVLVVDDEPGLRTLATYMLRSDYDVTCAAGVSEAMSILSTRQGAVDLILCDLMMPERSGPELYAEALARWPELTQRFVFMTGGAFTSEGKTFLETVDAPVLDKPFGAATLRATLAGQMR